VSLARRLRPLAAPVGLVALVLATRLPRLDRPRAFVFDEVYYALDAADLLRHGVEASPAHPPLAKWLIAGGIRVFGFTPVGWRSAALLAGIALVLVTWAAARRVTDRSDLALAAGIIVALDGVAFVTGRLALLDGFVAVTTTAAAWCVLGALADQGDPARLRRWRWAVALLLGLGTAMKWGAVWTWPVAAIVLVSLERRAAPSGPDRRRRTAAALAVLTLVPVGVYLAAYGPWFAQAERTRAGLSHCHGKVPCDLGALDRVTVWFDHQRTLIDFHANLDTDNPEAAPAWSWAVQSDPADLFSKICLPQMAAAPGPLDDGTCPDRDEPTQVRILALANPVSWVAGLLGLGVSAFLAVRRRDDAAGIVVGLAASQWLPWMLSGREVYSYYAVSLVPLLALATVLALDRLPRVRRVTLVPLLVGTAAAFVFLYPLLAGVALTDGAAELRLLLPGWS
jgi:dolichyl-phosphate-mannose--protein O-mannosyl transferase